MKILVNEISTARLKAGGFMLLRMAANCLLQMTNSKCYRFMRFNIIDEFEHVCTIRKCECGFIA